MLKKDNIMNKEIKQICIVGSGYMGKQIAARSILYGYNINLYDINKDSLEEAKSFVNKLTRREKEKRKNITYLTDLKKACSNSDLVIEAIPEDLLLKRRIFSRLEKFSPPHAILASNTSSIPISKIENAVERKDKLLNIHFYSPIPKINMADLMKGTMTDEGIYERAKQWLESIEVEPLILKKESFGFLFNRIWHVVKKEALKIWAEGIADIEEVDKAWKIFTGMPYGPFFMMDNVGLDVVYDIEMSYYKESGDLKDKPPAKLREMVENGALGLKSGKGFYKYRR
jgi:3-hydroxybutyryl-CoA dehydrogenase